MNLFTKHGRPQISTHIGRWMGVGPYYAMFPMQFAFEVIEQYTEVGEAVLDPFAGRASSIYAAAVLDRIGVGVEINPVGWLYGHVKLKPPSENRVLNRVDRVAKIAEQLPDSAVKEMPEFFHWCYSPKVLRFLIAARQELNWKTSRVDGTLMVIILIYLHGKRSQSLSNQMRQSKAMHPDYSVKWWRERDMHPPDIEPLDFLTTRIKWRYAKGYPSFQDSHVILGNSVHKLKNPNRKEFRDKKFSLLLTSPPYFDITNYHYDQWIRLWMLGEDSKPTWVNKDTWQKKFSGQADYKELLEKVFCHSKQILDRDAVIYVRTDARKFTFDTTLDVLIKSFPQKKVRCIDKPFRKETQTALYGDKSKKPGEVDIILAGG